MTSAGSQRSAATGTPFTTTSSKHGRVDAILEADFLTEEQKRAILRDNAARFLRLDEDTCR